MKWIGLTGGIASGKSTVSGILKKNHISVLDADAISHELTQVDQIGYQKIIEHFGPSILTPETGEIDRKQLGQIVFQQKNELHNLEQILHPLIQNKIKEEKQKFIEKGVTLCFYDVPLLFEKNMNTQFDVIVVVYVNKNVQIERLIKRNQFTYEEAKMRMNHQWPLIQKVSQADYCLDNSTNVEDLEIQVKTMIQNLTQKG